jgi:hypothetical protein
LLDQNAATKLEFIRAGNNGSIRPKSLPGSAKLKQVSLLCRKRDNYRALVSGVPTDETSGAFYTESRLHHSQDVTKAGQKADLND